ncbi:uncharacterized protein LOC131429066 [Malaya genurostris]|uniref:uncharacterized protein LOC131429066 n=1 Tax=Malaya genurostris TaxID=325434 RepID=UPI0026F3AFBE|nr:uncharacterized protein LOC131429066 [Malaya genurostris]
MTNIEDWRWVPSKYNIADEATKWGKGPCFSPGSRWFRGPEFLYESESEWPKKRARDLKETTEELRPCMVLREYVMEELIDFTRFSKWERLLRAVAYVRRFVTNCRHRVERQQILHLTQDELMESETNLWRMMQAAMYPDEVAVLGKHGSKKKQDIERSSKLYKLSPFMDEQGVLRVNGRIGAAPYVTYDFKFPIILPRYHRGTALLLDWYHRKYLHANRETVVNEVRQRFHVSNLRTVVRRMAKECQTCRNKNTFPTMPRMAPLPEARLTSFVRPFTYVGLDYFGPLPIKVGRSVAKRWVVLFTCLTVRAVHLEVAHSLSTEACKMAIRRFVARRGAPLEIYSDNGSNFQGASRDLLDEIRNMEQELADTSTDAHTNWIFNPPSAPHFGGVWERLVRSIKVALGSLTTLRNPDDETLLIILAEAESIVNSRPLTYLPLESAVQEALTPNHFLLLSSNGVVRGPKPLKEAEKVYRNNWDHTRQFVDHFWRRWIAEYMPTIAKRTKWHRETKAPVVVLNEQQRNGWIRGRIVSLVKGKDSRLRQAVVQTSIGSWQS